MKCKIFTAHQRQALEDQVNQWLESNPVTPDSMRFEYGAICLEDLVEPDAVIEHTLVLFYVPMMPIR